jgi:hypothetical protein
MNEMDFYKNLPALKLPVVQLFQYGYFTDVPTGWHIIISDVKNSTIAVNAGRHNDVNLVAAGSLIAALNVTKKHDVEVPFFFGGDGGTVLVPGELLFEVLAGLFAHNSNSLRNFGLEMHIGSIPVKEVIESGHSIKIAKLEIDAAFSKAITIGDGLRFAEQKIKEDTTENQESDINDLNLTGLECRWNRIRPQADEAENICYLIEAVYTNKQLDVYTEVFKKIEELYGDVQNRSPLSPERLKPLLNLRKLKNEMMAKFGKWRIGYFIEAFFRTLLGKGYFKYNWNFAGLSGKQYLSQLIAHADTLTIDGRINTIICSTRDKHSRFLEYLSEHEKVGHLIYGHHVSKESIMTCYIENRNSKHIHFVDGADGGYTEAAKEFKTKFKGLQLANNLQD